MKKLFITLVALFGFIAIMNAELTQSELSKLTSQERQTYLSQLKELNSKMKELDKDLFKANDMIKMGEEMQRDDGKQAGAAHIMKGMELKEKTEKAIKETQRSLTLLDSAARDAIKRNEAKK